MANTFPKGIHPKTYKELTEDHAIEIMPVPEYVYIPVQQHIGVPAIPVAEVGQVVSAGDLLAKANGAVSANIYASVSGTIEKMIKMPNVIGNQIEHFVIRKDDLDQISFFPVLEDPSSNDIQERIFQAGIVGMGGAAFPTHVKLSVPENKKIDTIIINAAECEPYITCDYRILLEKQDALLKGVSFIAKALSVDRVIIGIEENKREAIEQLRKQNNIEVIPLRVKYPQGAEKQLIYATTKRKVPLGKLPIDVGIVVINVATTVAVYEAVALGKPSYERVVTVSGRAVKHPKNLLVRTGTLIEDVLNYCGGLQAEAKKILSGGPMMGNALYSLRVAVTKSTSSLLFLTQEEINQTASGACINCARCHKVCPMNLMPMYIDAYSEIKDFANAKKYGANACVECGCCAYVCPAKRPLVSGIRLAKRMIKEKNL